jgi:hypothetical protein
MRHRHGQGDDSPGVAKPESANEAVAMKELREQLDAAKAEYRSVRYPGDLAAETLKNLHRPRRWMWLGGLATAAVAAATVATLVWMRWPTTNLSAPEIAVSPTTGPSAVEQFSLRAIERPSAPAWPVSPGAFPARQGISRPSFPGVPSWDALMKEQSSSSNTEESV